MILRAKRGEMFDFMCSFGVLGRWECGRGVVCRWGVSFSLFGYLDLVCVGLLGGVG